MCPSSVKILICLCLIKLLSYFLCFLVLIFIFHFPHINPASLLNSLFFSLLSVPRVYNFFHYIRNFEFYFFEAYKFEIKFLSFLSNTSYCLQI